MTRPSKITPRRLLAEPLISSVDAPAIRVDIGNSTLKLCRSLGNGRNESKVVPCPENANIKAELNRLLPTGLAGATVSGSRKTRPTAGVIGLTERFSAAAMVDLLERAGINVVYQTTFQRLATVEVEKRGLVDVLVVSGGLETFPGEHIGQTIDKLSLQYFPARHLMYAGHSSGSGTFGQQFPNAVICPNPFKDAFTSEETDLADVLANSLSNENASEGTEAPSGLSIQRTEDFIDAAFRHMSTGWQAPAMLVDIGGTFTRAHLKTASAQDPSPDTVEDRPILKMREFGVDSARAEVISRLDRDPFATNAIGRLYRDEKRDMFLNLSVGKAEQRVVALACLYFAIEAARDDAQLGPMLQTDGLSTIALTGGGSLALTPSDPSALASLIWPQAHTPSIKRDTDNCWWAGPAFEHADCT